MGTTHKTVKCPYCRKILNAKGWEDMYLPYMAFACLTESSINESRRITGILEKASITKTTQVKQYRTERPDGKKLYTEDDLWNLLGKIARAVYVDDSSNILSVMSTYETCEKLIKEFEDRFECKFRDAKKLFPHINPDNIFQGSDFHTYRKSDGKRLA